MKLTNNDLDILIELLTQKLIDISNGPEGTEIHDKPEIYRKLIKKLDKLYFS